MKKIFAVAIAAMSLVPVGAHAQERAGNAALGALSGAVVLGPVGAVAGAVVGFTAGPSISRAWGLRRSESRRRGPSAKRVPPAAAKQRVSTASDSAPRTVAQGTVREAAPPAATPAAQAGSIHIALPPVQAFD
jgi:hypothetical protein